MSDPITDEQWAKGVALLDDYLHLDGEGTSSDRVWMMDQERRVRLTGLDESTVVTWAKVFESMTSDSDTTINHPNATSFLAGFDLALRVIEHKMSSSLPFAPLLDGRNKQGGSV